MINPLKAIREARGLSRTRFALAIGTTHNVLQGIETGRIRTLGKAAAGLTRIGEDPEAVRRDLARWQEAEAEAILGTQPLREAN